MKTNSSKKARHKRENGGKERILFKTKCAGEVYRKPSLMNRSGLTNKEEEA